MIPYLVLILAPCPARPPTEHCFHRKPRHQESRTTLKLSPLFLQSLTPPNCWLHIHRECGWIVLLNNNNTIWTGWSMNHTVNLYYHTTAPTTQTFPVTPKAEIKEHTTTAEKPQINWPERTGMNGFSDWHQKYGAHKRITTFPGRIQLHTGPLHFFTKIIGFCCFCWGGRDDIFMFLSVSFFFTACFLFFSEACAWFHTSCPFRFDNNSFSTHTDFNRKCLLFFTSVNSLSRCSVSSMFNKMAFIFQVISTRNKHIESF